MLSGLALCSLMKKIPTHLLILYSLTEPSTVLVILRFLFMAELIWAVAAIFRSEANTAGSEWDRLPGFSAYQVFAS